MDAFQGSDNMMVCKRQNTFYVSKINIPIHFSPLVDGRFWQTETMQSLMPSIFNIKTQKNSSNHLFLKTVSLLWSYSSSPNRLC